MDFNELVRRRYSCRAYKTDAVEDDKVRSILEAGRLAPTARNDQPVRVIAVRSKEGLAKLEEAGHIYDAPLAFIVCSDKDKAWTRSYDGMKTTDIDASIVTTQMMYEATDMGLGTPTSSRGTSDSRTTSSRSTSWPSDTGTTRHPRTTASASPWKTSSDTLDLGLSKTL